MAQQTVLVTGATGFIASHCVLKLAKAGFEIRGTMRDLSRVPSIENVLRSAAADYAGGAKINIDWFEANLNNDAGWDEAIAGCDYVLHVASPISISKPSPKYEEDFIVPAKEGTLRVLTAASKNNVKRVVVTSSVASIIYGHQDITRPFTEKDWSDPKAKECSAYARSKTYAERAAWAFMEEDQSGMELSCVNPALVFGPILEKDPGASVVVIKMLLNGHYPGVPKISFGVVDVRDVADLHLLAMTHPDAAGKRFISCDKVVWIKEVVDVLCAHLPAYSKRLPKHILPNWLIKALAPFDARIREAKYHVGKKKQIDSSLARNVLGWTSRPFDEALRASADSLLKYKLIKPLKKR